MKKINRLFAVIILLCMGTAFGQGFEVGGGISKAVGDGSEYWNLGFNVNGSYFMPLSPNIRIGGRFAYNYWSPNEDELKSDFGMSDMSLSIDGSGTIIELTPSIRFVSPPKGGGTGFFAQAGVGYFIWKGTAEVSASMMGYSYTEEIEDSDEVFGVNFGGGIILGGSFGRGITIYPLYNILFTEDESTKYFTVNVGIGL